MHPFFRFTQGNPSKNRKEPTRPKSPTEIVEGEGNGQSQGEPQSNSNLRNISRVMETQPSLHKVRRLKAPVLPIIKVDDKIVFTTQRESENRTRLGPNRNNIIVETLQNDLINTKK